MHRRESGFESATNSWRRQGQQNGSIFNNALHDAASLIEGICAEQLPSLEAATRSTGCFFNKNVID
jgi:hypothetical protein